MFRGQSTSVSETSSWTRAGELRKHGLRIRLQDQSFQILRMLLERPGEVVLREEIRQKLWPNNTIVEFDHGSESLVEWH